MGLIIDLLMYVLTQVLINLVSAFIQRLIAKKKTKN